MIRIRGGKVVRKQENLPVRLGLCQALTYFLSPLLPMPTMTTLFAKIDTYLVETAQRQPAVSAASVGWHLDHSLRVIQQVSQALAHSEPTAYRWRFHLARSYVLLRGDFPRGRARAPQSVVPQQEPTVASLRAQVAEARQAWQALRELPRNSWFPHPYFGPLNRSMTERFLVVHTRHHLRIVRDILRKADQS